MATLFVLQYIDVAHKPTFEILDIGIVAAMSFVWLILLISIVLLITKTIAFLGNKFSAEKCGIYTMFITLTIGYAVAILVNSLLIDKNNSTPFKRWFKKHV